MIKKNACGGRAGGKKFSLVLPTHDCHLRRSKLSAPAPLGHVWIWFVTNRTTNERPSHLIKYDRTHNPKNKNKTIQVNISLHEAVTDRIPGFVSAILLFNKKKVCTFSPRLICFSSFCKQKKIWITKSDTVVDSGTALFLYKLPQAGVWVKPVEDQTHLLSIIISFLFIHQYMNGYNGAIETKDGFRGNGWQRKKLHQPNAPLFKELWTLIAAKDQAAAAQN